MSDMQFYELANAEKRGEVDLLTKKDRFVELFARSRPNAYDFRLFKDFYCFRLRESSRAEKISQARSFGKVLVKEIPEWNSAIRSYQSDGHPISNQLFKKVLGKGRQAYCEAELRKVGC